MPKFTTFLKRITNFGRKDNSGEHNNNAFLNFLKGGSAQNVSATKAYYLYNQNSALSDAIDMISNKFSTIIPVIKDENNEIVSEHEVLDFLKNPNKTEKYSSFANSIAVNYLLNKNSYLEILGFIKSKPTEIYNVKNSAVSIAEGINTATYLVNTSNFYSFLKANFKYDQTNGRYLASGNLQELYHIKGFILSSGTLNAVSKITSILRDVDILDQSNVHNLSLLTKGFSAPGILSLDTEDNDAFDQFQKDVQKRFSGAGNAGIPVASKGKDVNYTPFGQTNSQMQHKDTKAEAKKTIYQRYEIPSPLIDSSAQTYNNYQTALYALYDNAVLPLADKIFEALTDIFQTRKVLPNNWKITYDTSSIPALQLRRNEELKILKETGVLTINELRSLAGYERVDAGGDDVYIGMGQMPIASDLFTSDNLEKPKEFIDALIKNGFSENEAKEYWNEYKSIVRPNKKS